MGFENTFWNKRLMDATEEAQKQVAGMLQFYRDRYELKTYEDFATVCHEIKMKESRIKHLENILTMHGIKE